MATNPVYLQSLPDEEDNYLPAADERDAGDAQEFLELFQLMQNDQTVRRSDHVRRTGEVQGNRSLLVLQGYAVGRSCRAILNGRMGNELTSGCRLFDELIEKLDSSLSEDQRQLLQIAKDEFIAGAYEDRARAEKMLMTALRTTMLTALSRPDDDFRRLSPLEAFADGFTNRRRTLRRRGLPPIRWWQEVTDDLGLSKHADNRLRQDERARQQAFLTLLGAGDGEEV